MRQSFKSILGFAADLIKVPFLGPEKAQPPARGQPQPAKVRRSGEVIQRQEAVKKSAAKLQPADATDVPKEARTRIYRSKEELPKFQAVASAEGGRFALTAQVQQAICVLQLVARDGDPEGLQRYCVIATAEHFATATFNDVVERIKAGGGQCYRNGIADAGMIHSFASAGDREGESETSTAILDAARKLILDAQELGSSDVHLEGRPSGSVARVRVDGRLSTLASGWDAKFVNKLGQALWYMADDATKPAMFSDDCNFLVALTLPNGSKVQARVEVLPAYPKGSMDIIFRLIGGIDHVAGSIASHTLDSLGFHSDHSALIEEMTARPTGIVLAVGITGAGKSRTLGTLLRMDYDESQVNGDDIKKRISVESPPEEVYPGVTQIPAKIEDLPDVLHKVLRADPDLLMVTEIRESVSASLMVDFILSGHRGMSTLHADDGPQAIQRLHEKLGVPLNILADRMFISGIIAQKLIPKLCPSCKVEYDPNDPSIHQAMHERIAKHSRPGDKLFVDSPHGCEACRGTGVLGRTVVAETLMLDDEMRSSIARKDFDGVRALSRLQRQADDGRHFRGATKMEHAIYKMRQGILSPRHVESELGRLSGEVIEC